MDLGGLKLDLSSCDMSFWGMIIGGLFSCVGLVVLGYGKKNGRPRAMFIGAALMVYPYFVANAFLTAGIGAALAASLFFHRD